MTTDDHRRSAWWSGSPGASVPTGFGPSPAARHAGAVSTCRRRPCDMLAPVRENGIMSASVHPCYFGESFGRFIAASTWDAVPNGVRNEGKRSLLNFIGCALGVAHKPPIEMAL